MTKVVIYTDGACSGNPGPGGWAAILTDGTREKYISGGEEDTTNNRMELLAAIKGLEALRYPCEVDIYSDSQYLISTMTKGWKRNKNVDLWAMLDYYAGIHSINFIWVKGHASNEYNNKCDQMARAEITKIKTI